MDIPKKARNRTCTPWRLSVSKDLTLDELQALVAKFLANTKHHYVISGDVTGMGLSFIVGDYWGTKGRDNDLSQVARRWDEVAEDLGELMPDAVLEYRVPNALLDELEILDITDLTQAN